MGKMTARLVLLLGPWLLTACSAKPAVCEGFRVEDISWVEINGRFPNVVGANQNAAHIVDSSAFPAGCLMLQRPEFGAGLSYFETRSKANAEKLYLFDSPGMTDTLVGFTVGNRKHVFVVGVL